MAKKTSNKIATLASKIAKIESLSQNFIAVEPIANEADAKRYAITQSKPWPRVFAHKSESLVKTKRVHQIANLNRTQSYMACFPSLALVEKTGNAYSASIDYEGNLTQGKYKVGTIVGHVVFAQVMSAAEDGEFTAADMYYNEAIRAEVQKYAGKVVSFPENSDNKAYMANIYSDCLRDLEAIGLVYCTNSNGKYWREFKRSTYRVNVAMRDIIKSHKPA